LIIFILVTQYNIKTIIY